MGASTVKFDSEKWRFSYVDGQLQWSNPRESINEFLDYTLYTVYKQFEELDISVIETEINDRVTEFFSGYESDYVYEGMETTESTKESLTVEFFFTYKGDKEVFTSTAIP